MSLQTNAHVLSRSVRLEFQFQGYSDNDWSVDVIEKTAQGSVRTTLTIYDFAQRNRCSLSQNIRNALMDRYLWL